MTWENDESIPNAVEKAPIIWISLRAIILRYLLMQLSSKKVSRPDGVGGPYILRKAKASQLEPRAEKGPPNYTRDLGWHNAQFLLDDNSGDVKLDSDWLPRASGRR